MRDETIVDKGQCHEDAETKLENALSECEPKKTCAELADEKYLEGEEECSKIEDSDKRATCEELIVETREEEIRLCDCQAAAHAEFD
jgi:hypothetical protein